MDFMRFAFFGNVQLDNLCVPVMATLDSGQSSESSSSNVVGALEYQFEQKLSTLSSTRRGRYTIGTLSSHRSRFRQRA